MALKAAQFTWLLVVVIALAGGTYVYNSSLRDNAAAGNQGPGNAIVPVEVARVYHGPLSLRRTFSGTIEPKAKFTVAPKIGGRISRLYVDVSDQVARGQIVVQLEDAEFRQAVLEAEARFAVAEANRMEAVSRLEIAQRELDRARTLFKRGIASESTFDTAQASFLTSQAAVKVAEANLKKEEATLQATRIRLGYTRVQAEWQQGDNERTVAERFIDEGNTVAANTPLFSVVEIDPVLAVIQVTEKDYPLIRLGQMAKVQTDAYPDRVFSGKVVRIAPIFRESSRQAKMEIEVGNDDHMLKPGMFSRCTLDLDQVDSAVSVPRMALTTRNTETGVFHLSDDGTSVKWVAVRPGFTSGDQVQLIGSTLSGKVVTLGQQFIREGSAVRVAGAYSPATGGANSQ